MRYHLNRDNVIRFAPPLMISQEELIWPIERIQKVLFKISN
ncbi:hypothetical protein [Neobacillus sp. CF12]|nr:hypothetical protein [Neobacillus sp. CF12]MDM5328256.1 hypothetical protein [Neobacillus sp. CF12]